MGPDATLTFCYRRGAGREVSGDYTGTKTVMMKLGGMRGATLTGILEEFGDFLAGLGYMVKPCELSEAYEHYKEYQEYSDQPDKEGTGDA